MTLTFRFCYYVFPSPYPDLDLCIWRSVPLRVLFICRGPFDLARLASCKVLGWPCPYNGLFFPFLGWLCLISSPCAYAEPVGLSMSRGLPLLGLLFYFIPLFPNCEGSSLIVGSKGPISTYGGIPGRWFRECGTVCALFTSLFG